MPDVRTAMCLYGGGCFPGHGASPVCAAMGVYGGVPLAMMFRWLRCSPGLAFPRSR
jgi:hypothetical protein